MFLNYYSCFSAVFTFSVLQTSYTLSVLNQSEKKLETEIKLILDRHNQYRTCHHAPPLVIDSKLTKEAQSLANALASEQINLEQARRWRHGNLFITQWNLQLDDLFAINEKSKFSFNPVDKWYNEVKFYLEDRSRTDHFTRIVWKDTKRLGVGIAQNERGFVYVVCKYDPEGNIPGLYDKNVVIPDEKMIHATDICVFPPMTSPSKKKGKTTSTKPKQSTVPAEIGSGMEPASAASASDYKVTSTDSQNPIVIDDGTGIGSNIFTAPSTTTRADLLSSLQTGSMTPTHSASVASAQTGSPSFLDSITPGPDLADSLSTSVSGSQKSTHLGSMTWSRPPSSMIPGSLSTPGISVPTGFSIPTNPVPVEDLLIPPTPSPEILPQDPVDRTPSPFGSFEWSTSTTRPGDIFPSEGSVSESTNYKFDNIITSSTIAPYLSSMSTFEPPYSSSSLPLEFKEKLCNRSNVSGNFSCIPEPTSSSLPLEFKEKLCNKSDASGNLSCILPPTDSPQYIDFSTTPASNKTGWLDLPDHDYSNQTGDAFGSFDKPENKAEYLRFTLLFMGLLVASMSAAVSLLAVFAIFKLFVCCRRARGAHAAQDVPSSPAAQTPSNLVSVIPTTNPRPISPTLSRPGSPVFQRTVLSAKLY